MGKELENWKNGEKIDTAKLYQDMDDDSVDSILEAIQEQKPEKTKDEEKEIMTKQIDSEAEYWQEEVDRINALADFANKAGYVVDVLGDDAEPPELNEDGSLKETSDEG